MTSILFEPGNIGTMQLRNRLIKSATFESLSSLKGECTEELRAFHRRVAAGGIGLTIVAYVGVHETGLGYAKQSRLDRDEFIPGFQQLTQQMHAEGAKVAAQLHHAGRVADPKLIGGPPLGPSEVPDKLLRTKPKEMTEDDIEMLLQAQADAAVRAKEAGFDAVELHCAHGYLISQFLSPVTNQRNDAWGGTLEKRQRFALESIRRIKAAVGTEYPVFAKLNSQDFLKNGLTLEESKDTAQKMAQVGLDALEISGGFTESVFFISRGEIPIDVILRGKDIQTRLAMKNLLEAMQEHVRLEHEAYYLPAAKEIKPLIDIPLILVGGLRSRAVMEEILQQDHADFISIARPLIREPNLPNKFQSGESEAATCVSCNRCLAEMGKGNPLRCYYTG